MFSLFRNLVAAIITASLLHSGCAEYGSDFRHILNSQLLNIECERDEKRYVLGIDPNNRSDYIVSSRMWLLGDLVIDSDDKPVVAGYFYDELYGNLSSGFLDTFLVKYGSLNREEWVHTIGDVGAELPYRIVIDRENNIYLAVESNSSYLKSFVGLGEWDIYVVKFDSSGVEQWSQQIGSNGDDFLSGLAVDSNGNVVLAGTTSEVIDGNISQGREEAFVSKLDKAGAVLWTKQSGTDSSIINGKIAVDSYGNFYVGSGLLIKKYNSEGAEIWSREIEYKNGKDCSYGMQDIGGVFQYANDMVIDATGNVHFLFTLEWNASARYMEYRTHYLIKFDASGRRLWEARVDDSCDDSTAKSMALDSNNQIYVTGTTVNDDRESWLEKDYEIYLTSFSPGGCKNMTTLLGSENDDFGLAVDIDSNEQPYILGYSSLYDDVYEKNYNMFLIRY